jgi:hypothetical protein
MSNALASKKAIPSRPWFSNTIRRLPAGRAVTAVLELPQILGERREALTDDRLLTLTRYFQTGQASRLLVCRHI